MSSLIPKLLAMLGSDSDGEVLNAVRALRQVLKDNGRNFSDLAADLERARRNTPEAQMKEWWKRQEQARQENLRRERGRREQREREKKAKKAKREREKRMPGAERRKVIDLRLIQAMLENGFGGHSKAQLLRFPELLLRADAIGWSLEELNFIRKQSTKVYRDQKEYEEKIGRRVNALREKVKRQLSEYGI